MPTTQQHQAAADMVAALTAYQQKHGQPLYGKGVHVTPFQQSTASLPASSRLKTDGQYGPNVQRAAAWALGMPVSSMPPFASQYKNYPLTWLPPTKQVASSAPAAKPAAKPAPQPVSTKPAASAAKPPATQPAAAKPPAISQAPAIPGLVPVGVETNNPGLPPAGAVTQLPPPAPSAPKRPASSPKPPTKAMHPPAPSSTRKPAPRATHAATPGTPGAPPPAFPAPAFPGMPGTQSTMPGEVLPQEKKTNWIPWVIAFYYWREAHAA